MSWRQTPRACCSDWCLRGGLIENHIDDSVDTYIFLWQVVLSDVSSIPPTGTLLCISFVFPRISQLCLTVIRDDRTILYLVFVRVSRVPRLFLGIGAIPDDSPLSLSADFYFVLLHGKVLFTLPFKCGYHHSRFICFVQ